MRKIFYILIFIFFIFFGRAVSATTIFSPLLEIEAEPGEVQNGIVKLFNETDHDLFLASSIEPFTASGETGQPLYLAPEQKYTYLNWFNIDQDSILLKPGQVAIIPFTVTVPFNASPGGYYSVIFWQDSVGELGPDANVGISSKVGTLIFLKVKGDIIEEGGLEEFKVSNNKKYFFELPIGFTTRFANSGNIHLKPTGQIEIKGWFNQKEIIEINPSKRSVLPLSVRRFEVVWGQGQTGNFLQKFWSGLQQDFSYFSLGQFKATLTLTYGVDNPQTVTREIKFWLISYRMIIAFLLIIFVLIALIKINKKVKKFKQSAKNKQE